MKLVILIVFASIFYVKSCPPESQLHSCSCTQLFQPGTSEITCKGTDSDTVLANVVKTLVKTTDVYTFKLKKCSINVIPSDVFKGAAIRDLEILESHLLSLTDTDVAFVGLEMSLERLALFDCSFLGTWDWSVFRNLKKLTSFGMMYGNLEEIERIKDFNSDRMKQLSIENCHVIHLDDYAFSDLENLEILHLDGNKITKMKRSMFPRKLRRLYLADNHIHSFPEGIFDNMPYLTTLDVGFNHLISLNENVFSPIWSQLHVFDTSGNTLRCDCKMKWLVDKPGPTKLVSKCATPETLNGLHLEALTQDLLWCSL